MRVKLLKSKVLAFLALSMSEYTESTAGLEVFDITHPFSAQRFEFFAHMQHLAPCSGSAFFRCLALIPIPRISFSRAVAVAEALFRFSSRSYERVQPSLMRIVINTCLITSLYLLSSLFHTYFVLFKTQSFIELLTEASNCQV